MNLPDLFSVIRLKISLKNVVQYNLLPKFVLQKTETSPMSIKKHIPNLITLLNLLSGCIALVFAFQEQFEMAFYFVCLGIFFDFFDGFFARLYHVSSPLGLQLDSLADMVTSGVVPGTVMYFMLSNALRSPEIACWNPDFWVACLGFLITLGSCYRLANFNIDTRQSDSFIGLPTPANALFILSLPLVIQYSNSLILLEVLTNTYVLLAITLLSVYLLNAEIPLFSLKIKNFSLQKYALQIGFVCYSIVILIFLRYLAVPLIILSYVLLSLMHTRFSKR
jgi:CDP-diacylglycerol---serine O-phosphatidyltransferase